MSFQNDKPYNNLPPLPPKVELETRSVLKLCIEARARLAELKQLVERIPNQAILINTIPLLEAQASSEIENIVTTNDQLFRFAEQGEQQADPATKEALRYRTALKDGFSSLATRPLCTATAVAVCRTIKNTDLDIRQVPGTKLANAESGELIYTPPEGESVIREKLANWETFLHQEIDLDPLVRMAAAHYQFEAIHPFTDGNGRTGRILNILFLCDQQLITIPVLYLSSYINRSKADYYSLLLSVTTNGNWTDWIEYMLEGVRSTAEDTCNRIDAINDLRHQIGNEIRETHGKIYSHELVEQLFAQPYTRISNLVDAGIAKRQTASSYLQTLTDAGILDEHVFGKEKLFLFPRLVGALTQPLDV
ncbi:MAG: protein adenylyltransferase Fic [Granulosicoccus sp.]